jgi:hypothetical protein
MTAGVLGKIAAIAVMALLTTEANAQSKAFLLYGGENNQTFLGCLNCGKFGTVSVCNKFGGHGSEVATDSIWNEFGTFGSEFSSSSPWNEFTSSAPVIVDKDGNFYGHFSANEFHTNRTRAEWADRFFKVAKKLKRRADARDLLCA